MLSGSYCGHPPSLAEVATRWNGDPVMIAVLVVALAFALKARNPIAAGGVGLLALAFVSPLCAASVALFSARTVHHLLLILGALAFAMAAGQGGASGRRLAQLRPPVGPATIAMTVVLWGWHIPALYDAALDNTLIYWAMQVTITATSFAFWLGVRRASAVGATGGLLGGTVQMGLLGALLTFASPPLYVAHTLVAPSWGLTGLEDQQLAGLIMWVGGMMPFAIGGSLVAMRGWQSQTQGEGAPRAVDRPA